MSIFQQIIDRQIPARIVFEDDRALAFHDVRPQAPVHILIIPKKPLVNVASAGPEDEALLGHLLRVAAKVAREQGLEPGGYRLVTNVGVDGGQTVYHLHIHLLGGRAMGWPPG